jgi:hypothetical protein
MLTVCKAISALAAASTVALCAAQASAATVINAGWGDGCSKSSCFNDQGVYTHSWSAGNTAGPITIGQLSLDRSILGSFDGKMFRLSFQIGGQEVGSWGKFLMAGIGGDTLTFGGDQFTWNPEDGDLVLVLQLIPPPKAGGGLAAFALTEGPILDQTGDGPPKNDTGGPQNDPPGDISQPGAVPEPGTWALMITGFGGAGAVLRRRRAVLGMQL